MKLFFPQLAGISKNMVYLQVMNILIIHPQDPTTEFLSGIYNNIPGNTVINGGVTKDELQKHIDDHDRVILCGHGSPTGLFSVGQFPDAYPYVIDESMVESLRNKDCIFIWCNADQFVQRHSLYGFFSGMFISEPSESLMFGFDVDWDIINESNYGFSSVVSRYIEKPLDVLYENVITEYGILARTNPIASFNFKRLYLYLPELRLKSDKVG